MTSRNGAGEHALTWSEMKAYSDAMKLDFEPWEYELLRGMSNTYLAFKVQATENRPLRSPYDPQVTRRDLINRFKKSDELNTFEAPDS